MLASASGRCIDGDFVVASAVRAEVDGSASVQVDSAPLPPRGVALCCRRALRPTVPSRGVDSPRGGARAPDGARPAVRLRTQAAGGLEAGRQGVLGLGGEDGEGGLLL